MFISATCLAGAYGDKLAYALEKGHQLLTLSLFIIMAKIMMIMVIILLMMTTIMMMTDKASFC